MMGSKTTISRLRQNFGFIPAEATVDHLVIGAGVVGLAIARELTNRFRDRSTFVVERNAQPGQETSSRNSEVIHAGIYYPQDSLKTRLCIRGRNLLYEYCRKQNIPHKKIGKIIISKSREEKEYLSKLYTKCQVMNEDEVLRRAVNYGRMKDSELVSLRKLNQAEVLKLEPDLSQEVGFGLFSPETGIIDSHAFISSLENSIEDSENGELVYGTKVVRIDRSSSEQGWVIQTLTNDNQSTGGQRNSVLGKCVINCAGLNAHNIYNHLLYPRTEQLQLGFCKGSYYSYNSPKGVSSIGHLIYPTPIQGSTKGSSTSGVVGLGTHLTLDLNNKIRFGPDVEWLDIQSVHSEELQDFWINLLNPNDQTLESTYLSVKSYLPGIDINHLSPDYSGIRPKLSTNDKNLNESNLRILNREDEKVGGGRQLELSDFYIQESEPGFVNLFGIESPGLTSSLAIGEYLSGLIAHIFDGPRHTHSRNRHPQQRFSTVGKLDDWAN
ncbi:hypothetical protein H4Q26_002812 [Puccinia striiformis f. sp. tritici PST-130]|nr:hypothetical protein Pst134EB_012211 [Puccinia striiformis f. sp. tritici]KAI9604842.1 hypothetical protein H4Q26_002812 [Puccinia striiformis f. sp. tritici PST-130]